MRKLMILAATLLTTSTVWADTESLGAAEVKAHLKTVDAEIAQCYLGAVGDKIGAGRLDVKLTIHRKGIVDHIDVIAPGVDAKTVKKIDACVREVIAHVSAFPTRRVGTTAVVPYYWQKTSAPGDGPQLSCWNPKGCKAGSDGREGDAHASQPAPLQKKITGRQARRAKAST